MRRNMSWGVAALVMGWCAVGHGQADEAVETTATVPGIYIPSYEPWFSWPPGGLELSFPMSISERVEAVSAFPVDLDGAEFDSDPAFNTQILVGAGFNTRRVLAPLRLKVDFQARVLSGRHSGGDSDLQGIFVPDTDEVETSVDVASLQVDFGPYVHMSGGLMLSHWGMGLVANDGRHGWKPGSAQFVDPRGGDRVLRGLFALGPFLDNGLVFAAGLDEAVADDALLAGDDAFQVLLSALYGVKGGPYKLGAYVVSRDQEAIDGDFLRVNVFDVYGAYERRLGESDWKVKAEMELAYITGKTTLGPSPDFPEHDVKQFGGAMKLAFETRNYGFVLDSVYTTGDANIDDGSQNGFKADVNFPLGLVMHRYVLAAISSRAPVTISNPDLIGIPPEDLDRLPTQGAVTNTVAFFPKAWVRVFKSLEIYGGPLIALSEVEVGDPFNTRVAGGAVRNAFDGEPGQLLGVELDLGIRYHRFIAGSELTIGIEGGHFLPGEALVNASGETMGSVSAGRATLDFKF